MRRLILTTGLLAVALMATPQSASAQLNQPPGGGGGQQQPNLSDPRLGDRPDARPSMRPSDESIGGGGGQQMPNPSAPPRTGGNRNMAPSDQPIGGGGGMQEPPLPPRR